jgi:hypothetical protein
VILIYSERENAQVGLSGGRVDGAQVPNRTYTADGHFLAIDGDDAALISNDAQLILAFGPSEFRLADAGEQNVFTSAQQGKSGTLLKEGGGKDSAAAGNGKNAKASAAASGNGG